MPFPHSEGETLGLNDGAGGCGQGLADGVGLAVLIRHEETVLDAIKVGLLCLSRRSSDLRGVNAGIE